VGIQVLLESMKELIRMVESKKMERQNLLEDDHENIVELDQDLLLLQIQMVVEQMKDDHSDVLQVMDEVKVWPVETMDYLDENHKLLDQMESLFDVRWDEELYSKHHDDERLSEVDDLDEMMTIKHRLEWKVYYDLAMEDLHYRL